MGDRLTKIISAYRDVGDVRKATVSNGGRWGNPERFDTAESVRSQVRRMGDGRLFDHEERAIERYFTKPGARALDLGCGTGRVTRALADRGLDVTGVDVSGSLLDEARSLLPGLPFVRSDAASLPFTTDSFHYVIFAYNGLDYLVPESRRTAALREIRRVLRPSGVFLYSSHNRWYTLPALVLDHGFLERTYRRPKNRGRTLDRYKFENAAAGDLKTYFSDPLRVWRELSGAGFDQVDIVGNNPFPLSLVERSPYYVARPRRIS